MVKVNWIWACRAILALKAKDQMAVAKIVIEKSFQYVKQSNWFVNGMSQNKTTSGCDFARY
jgi:hypothetical protein